MSIVYSYPFLVSGGGATSVTIQPITGTSPVGDTITISSTDGSMGAAGNSTTDTLDLSVLDNAPSKVLYKVWDFFGYSQAGSVAQEGWEIINNGSGSNGNTDGGFGIDSTHPGILRCQTGTTTTGFGGAAQGTGFVYGIGTYTHEMLVQIPTLSDGTDTFVFLIGMGADFSSGTDFASGCYFRYTHGSSSGNWEFKSSKSSVRTTVDTGIAVVAGTWYKLKYIMNAAGTSAQAYINDVAVGSAITSNIANTFATRFGPCIHLEKTAGTTNRLAYVDYMMLRIVMTTAR